MVASKLPTPAAAPKPVKTILDLIEDLQMYHEDAEVINANISVKAGLWEARLCYSRVANNG